MRHAYYLAAWNACHIVGGAYGDDVARCMIAWSELTKGWTGQLAPFEGVSWFDTPNGPVMRLVMRDLFAPGTIHVRDFVDGSWL